jgi:hypothetical protein
MALVVIATHIPPLIPQPIIWLLLAASMDIQRTLTTVENPESEIPRFRVSAGSLTLWEGISASAASWFKLLPILYSYVAILEVIS